MKKKHYVWLNFVVIVLILGLFSQKIINTYAYFNSTAGSKGNTIRAADIKDYISVRPGKNQPLNPDEHPKNQGRKYCYDPESADINLGIVMDGSNRNFNELIKIKNVSESVLDVYWEVSGDISPLLENDNGFFKLSPETESSSNVAMEEDSINKPESRLLIETLTEDSVFTKAYQGQYSSILGNVYDNASQQVIANKHEEKNHIPNEYPISLKHNIGKDTPAGYYEGKLRVYLFDGYPSLEIPIYIRIEAPQKMQKTSIIDLTYPTEEKAEAVEAAPISEDSTNAEQETTEPANNAGNQSESNNTSNDISAMTDTKKPEPVTTTPNINKESLAGDSETSPSAALQEAVNKIADTIFVGGENK